MLEEISPPPNAPSEGADLVTRVSEIPSPGSPCSGCRTSATSPLTSAATLSHNMPSPPRGETRRGRGRRHHEIGGEDAGAQDVQQPQQDVLRGYARRASPASEPMQFVPPITANASALSIGSWPQIAR